MQSKAHEPGSKKNPDAVPRFENVSSSLRVVSEPVEDRLNERKLLDYESHKRDLLQWLLTVGKDPDKGDGYAEATVRQVSYKVDSIYRWKWDREGYTISITPGDADEYLQELSHSDEEYSRTHLAITQKCLQRVFKWRRVARGETVEWEPDHTFTSNVVSNPRDYLTKAERRKVREAALEYGSIPAYNGLSPGERDTWREYLAQRFEKPKSEVGPADWDRANGWKVPSLVWASLDAGLRPVEVERAKTTWVDVGNGVLRIPKSDSSKNRDNWIVPITERTAKALERWIAERDHYDSYADTDTLWLTRQGNPYGSSSLRYVLHRLCDIAGISTTNRQMSWYAIRHSVGTYMSREEGLAAAQAQLRHKSSRTTMRYDQAPVEDRQRALGRMG